MIKFKNGKRKKIIASSRATLPAGVKVVDAPLNAFERELLAGADIGTGGGLRTRIRMAAKGK